MNFFYKRAGETGLTSFPRSSSIRKDRVGYVEISEVEYESIIASLPVFDVEIEKQKKRDMIDAITTISKLRVFLKAERGL